jgi:hypothetical protein
MNSCTQWLLQSDEPWTRYRTLVDWMDREANDPEVQQSRQEMISHPRVQALIREASTLPKPAIKRHNDAGHPLHKLTTLADMGFTATDPGLAAIADSVLGHPSPHGALQSTINVPQAFGGSGEDMSTWVLCDAPSLLYAMLAMGLGDDGRVRGAISHLTSLVADNGWRCVAAPELGKFRGPGKRTDPCPIANVLALKALALVPEMVSHPAVHIGTEMLLSHWEHRRERKFYLFAMGTDFCKLKYPFVWYDILHVADVLSRFRFVHSDERFRQMVATITAKADPDGRYTAESMYQAWKGWSFADKKRPSPWLTFLVLRLQKRLRQEQP